MKSLIETILNIISSLFGGRKKTAPPPDLPETVSPTAPSGEATACTLADIEIPPDMPLDNVPVINTTAEVATTVIALAAAPAAQAAEASAQALDVNCTATIKPNLGNVNIRTGPRLEFLPMVQTQGGVTFDVVGAANADADGYRWFALQLSGGNSGWIRGDLITLDEECTKLTFIDESDLTPVIPTPDPVTDRFPLPVNAAISQGYHSGHKGLDMASPTGTELRAVTTGVCIRRIDCTACDESHKPNMYPCPDWMYRSVKWGYGYGNFIVVRHNYNAMPQTLRSKMDGSNLTNGFVYVLYAHMSQVNVSLGDILSGGTLLGLTGNHGCSSGDHLHFEVRIGKDEVVDGRWLSQTAVNPNLMFEM